MHVSRLSSLLVLGTAMAAGPAEAQTFSTLRSFWNPTAQDNLCSSSPTIFSSPPAGYAWFRNDGQVFNSSAALPAGLQNMRRLNRWYSPSRADHYTTTDPGWQGSAGQTRSPDYIWQANEGWVFTDPVAGTSELRGYYSAARGDNFITSDTRYTTYNLVPGYTSAGWQGYVINDPLGRSELLPGFNFGEMYLDGGPAVGFKRLLPILISYTDSPMRHTAAQFQSVFFGPGFPNVADSFWANSMGSMLWYNAGIRGPLVLANDPDTTGNESRWQDVWDPTYAPFLYLVLRTSNGTSYISSAGGAGAGASAGGGGFGSFETFGLHDVNGGNLMSGDIVAFKTLNGTWLRVVGTSVMGDGASSASNDCRFTVTKVSGAAGAQVVNGDVIRLNSVSTSKLLRAVSGGGGLLVCDTAPGSPVADNSLTILKTAVSSTLQAREAIKAVVAGGLNMTPFDDNGDGIITDDEMQLFLLGASPTPAAGAGARAIGAYQPPGSAVSVNLSHVIGAGEDVGVATMLHELTHALGAGYEMYGAYGLNNTMALMGPTITIPNDPRVYLHDPWTRMRFGWLEPRVFSMTDIGASATLEVSDAYPPSANKRPILLFDPLRFNLTTGEGEFFMVEYRNPDLSPTSYDTGCAARGMYLWQCKTGPGGTNIILPSALGACCTGAACAIAHEELCGPGSTYKGDGTACASNACPAGTPPVTAIDGSINTQAPYAGPGGTQVLLRGDPSPWTQAIVPAAGIAPKYVDNSIAPVRIRIGSMSADGRSMDVEWSYSGDLPPRIDSLDRFVVRRGSLLTLNGMFGVRTPNVDLRTGTTLVSSMSVYSRTNTRVTGWTSRTAPPVGLYLLNARSTSFLGNQVQVRITYATDWNEDGVLNVADIFAMLTDWFAGNGDYTGNGFTTVNDIFSFLADWFAGT